MTDIRISRTLESTTLYLPELLPFIGKRVELTVREQPNAAKPAAEAAAWVNPLRGSVLRDDDPFGPAVAPDEWEPNR